jgi:pectate lyase
VAGEPIEGFGADVTGGAGKPTFTITSLADTTAAGTMRTLLHATDGTKGDRIVRFSSSLSGNIPIRSAFTISGRNITFDGADAPNVTIGSDPASRGFIVEGRNIIFRNLRLRDCDLTDDEGHDAFGCTAGCEGIVWDHCSMSEVEDELITFNPAIPGFWDSTASQFGLSTGSCGHATIQYCIIGPNVSDPSIGQLLMKLGGAKEISIHHCIFYNSTGRMPRATGEILDIRMNIIARWRSGAGGDGFAQYGMTALVDSQINSINNYFAGPNPGSSGNNGWNRDGGPLTGDTPQSLTGVYESGTERWDGGSFPTQGTKATPYTVDAVTTTDAITAALATLASAGHTTRDAVDEEAVAWIRSQDARLEGALPIAFDAISSDVHTTVSPLSWTHTPVSTPRGILVYLVIYSNHNDLVTAATYGGVAMARVAFNPKATGSLVGTYAYFLGTSIPTGPQTVAVTCTGGAPKQAVSISVTAGGDTEVQASSSAINNDSLANPVATLGLNGVASFVSIGFNSGHDLTSEITPFANWTSQFEDSATTTLAGFYTYDIIGTADVSVGWTQTADDAVAIAVAISQISVGTSPLLLMLAHHEG